MAEKKTAKKTEKKAVEKKEKGPAQVPPKKETPFYYVTLFKLQGQNVWRASLGAEQEHFEKQWKSSPTTLQIVETKVIRIDRKTAELEIK